MSQAGTASGKKTNGTLRAQIGEFVILPVWVMKGCAEDPRALQLYAYLQKRANRERKAWPPRGELTRELVTSGRSLDRAIATLKQIGALQTIRRHRASDGAVIGVDYVLIQVDPASHAATGGDQDAGLSATDGEMDLPATENIQENAGPDVLSATGGEMAPATPTATDGAQAAAISPPVPSLNATGGDAIKEQPDPHNQIQERTWASAPPPPDRPPLVQVYHDGFVRRFQEKPVIAGGKDGKLLQQLERTHSYERVCELLDWFFRTPDPFIRQTGYTVGVFYACANKLLLTCPVSRDAVVEKHEALLREIHERSERRQAELEQEARSAIIALPAESRERLKVAAIAAFDLERFSAGMAPEQYRRVVKQSMVGYVVGLLREPGQSVPEALAQFARKEQAA